MDRRTILGLIGGAALAAGGPARAQPKLARIGYLSLGSPAAEAARFDAFRAQLAALGHVEGRTCEIVTRWLDGAPYARLGEMARELAALPVDVLVTYATPGVTAARAASETIPIVFASLGDALAVGVVASLARPGGNVTGTSYFIPRLVEKRLELVRDALPQTTRVAVLFNPGNASSKPVLAALADSAQAMRVTLVEAPVARADDLAGAFDTLAAQGIAAAVLPEDPMLIYAAADIARLAAARRIAVCGFPELAEAGGLAGYGVDFVALWRRAAIFTDRILKGARPAELPVEQATSFLTVVNLKAAQAIGLTLPAAVTLRADRVIE
jgi:putative ABC transport system substrate-binding protein